MSLLCLGFVYDGAYEWMDMPSKDRKRSTSVPPVNKGVAGRPEGSIFFEPCKSADVSAFIREHHYSHVSPGGLDYAFRLIYNGALAGAAVFGWMGGNPRGMCILRTYDDPGQYRELKRLVLLDEVPKNSESRFVGWCIRWLRDNTPLVALLSFADPKYGHSGTIYKASQWIYTGLQKQDRPRMIIAGKEVHPRTVVARYGTSSVSKLAAMGVAVKLEHREPKHRYVYVLRPALRPLLKLREVAW